jgi:glycosyltransferase involved in cell wall biosynthesis
MRGAEGRGARAAPHAQPALPSLAVVIPAFNAAPSLPATLAAVTRSVLLAGWPEVEVIVVDDGSTDATASVARDMPGEVPVRVVSQENRGRFGARLRGIEEARSQLILLLDSRVETGHAALSFLAAQLRSFPERTVWNGHVTIDTRGNPYAGFWQAFAHLAWPKYMRRPALTSFGEEDFDAYPKGTTCFVAPRQALLEACASFQTFYDDLRLANDDTILIRDLARGRRIFLGPEFSFRYEARDSFSGFLRHSFHRGIVLVDGFLHPGNRWFAPLVAFLVATPAGAVVALRRPRTALAGLVALSGIAAIGARAVGTPRRSAIDFGILTVPFGFVYGAGIWTGVAVAARDRVRRPRR